MTDFWDSPWKVAGAVILIICVATGGIVALSFNDGPFTTTTIGTISQVQVWWNFTTISFVSNGQTLTCWNLHTPVSVGERIALTSPAWTWSGCRIQVLSP